METKKNTKVNKPKFSLSDKCVFTEKSLTMPGQAYSAGELLRRSQNGTMPPIYQECQPYDFDDIVDGKQVPYEYQEQFDCEPIPAFPQLEDIFHMRDIAKEALNKANYLIKKQMEEQKKAEENVATPQSSANAPQSEL